MWPFTRKPSLLTSGAIKGFCDCHSHLLPDVDDGSPDMESTLRILAQYERWGIREVWLTPHIMEDEPNSTDHLRQRFAELQASYDGPLPLRLMSENMLDNLFVERLAKDDFLTYGTEGNELLVETSCGQPPMDLLGLLRGIAEHGLKPVLAHPERYVYMSMSYYHQLQRMGVRFQLNITSLAGFYGPEVRDRAELLYGEGAYRYFGTDCHSLEPLKKAMESRTLRVTLSGAKEYVL